MTGALRQFVVVSALLHSAVLGYAWHARQSVTTDTTRRIEIALAAPDVASTGIDATPHEPPQSRATTSPGKVAPARTETLLRPRALRTVNARRDAARESHAENTNRINAGATANTPDNQAPTAADRARVIARLRTALDRYFSYPQLARRHGWQGLVELRLRVESDGRLSHIELARSSGHAVLDQAALNSTRSIITVGDAAGHLHGTSVDLLLPVEYRLIDG